MLQKIYTVYDSKVETYLSPFISSHKGQALRDFERVANDSQTTVGQYPADFTLFEIGEFDTVTGKIHHYEAKQSLGIAIEFVKSKN
jgi:hypothetical protein